MSQGALSCLIGDSDTGRAVHSQAHPNADIRERGEAESAADPTPVRREV
jgi:hypothetical protein